MEQYGQALAGAHRLTPGRAADKLLPRLAVNESILIGVCNMLTEQVAASGRITPAGEWLLDNFYLIEEQIRTAKRHLPKGYSRELPRLSRGPSAGLPRVYDIALQTISHGDGRVDAESLSRYVSSYQKVTPLKLGELWAIPIMLRLALIENLRRVAVTVASGMIDRDLAGTWADQMTEVAENDPKSLILIIADMARSKPPVTTQFVSEFARRLQGQSAALALPLTWLEQVLSESQLTIEQQVQLETQKQASNQVAVSNSIGSLRFLGAMDWREFVETMSHVEQTLRQDPGSIYGEMDFATRDCYRHVIEKTAKKSRFSETEIAGLAIQLAQQGSHVNHNANPNENPNEKEIANANASESANANANASESESESANESANESTNESTDSRNRHVGYYLIDKGLALLEQRAEKQVSRRELLRRAGRNNPLLPYLGGIALITALVTGALMWHAYRWDAPDWLLWVLLFIALPAVSQLALSLVNWLATLLVTPRALPRMDYTQGIPPESRTLVVVPTLLMSAAGIEQLAEALEVRFLANRDDHLHFALLTDFRDAPTEHLPGDDALVQLAADRIRALNERHAHVDINDEGDIFYLFHRPRRWNAQEKTWMGYERKRGKLAELNALLRGGAQDCFSIIVGATAVLANVRYVITLDTDTQLPRDAAREFIGTMAHPLNRPRYDEKSERVVEGYGILQPRVAVSLPVNNQSRYARLFGSEPGIDPYTRAVSDVYQDVFGEGSFIGKGIYEVDAFERALSGRFPENRILSHDLLEGCYVRAALVSDVELYEEYPARYSADVSRRHRWIRGDWQIASWLLPHVPGHPPQSKKMRRNPLTALSQWKIFDNLRRSLVPAALTTILLLGWGLLAPAWFWTLCVLGLILVPGLAASLLELFRKPDGVLAGQHISATMKVAATQVLQALFTLACLPYETWFSLDAILRTNWRIFISNRRLLEWVPSGSSSGDPGTLGANFRRMWVGPVLAVATAAWLIYEMPVSLLVATPVLLLWFFSPAIAWFVSRPLPRREARLSAGQYLFLRKNARKTWSFFETFVGAEDNWLPPDNFQEHPVAVVAHRTSPTNMGLSLLANLTAYDFGYITGGVLLERTSNALATMFNLGRHRSHFYNWYDTQSLQPLHPLYVSSVDSGNLAGHLLTLRPGLLALPDQKIIGPRIFDGLLDTMYVLADAAIEQPVARMAIARFQKELETICAARPGAAEMALWSMHGLLNRMLASAQEIVQMLPLTNTGDAASDAARWAQSLAGQCQASLDELAQFTPWIAPAAPSERLQDVLESLAIPSLRELASAATTAPVTDLPWLATIEQQWRGDFSTEEQVWLDLVRAKRAAAATQASARIEKITTLQQQVTELAAMDYSFLYDTARHLLTIGYNVSDRRQDTSYYDMLASEARLANFVGIAQGQLPQESWFALGRLLTPAGGEPTLLSWSGSMFEYLMPLLVMPTYANTLLDRTYIASVQRQIDYGNQRGVAWGISESGYNTVDAALNYQYRAFGVPGLGLKRGLADDLVVSPYATALALMVMPEEACANLQRLSTEGLAGKYGFYEAVDYTPSRLPRGQASAVIRSFMAHHQGMVLLSLSHVLLERPMQKRFESDPMFQATALLLQERVPKAGAMQLNTARFSGIRATANDQETPIRVIRTPNTPTPEIQLLSNSHYHVMVTNAGGGYSRWKDLAVTRWREDSTCDNWGTFCYVRDVTSGMFWSNTHQPTLKKAENYEAIFSEGRAEFRRRDLDYATHTEIVVSPEDDIELRRVHITNRARTRRTIDVTSYAEVVLAVPAADALHPAFSNLFVQTEIVRERQAILCTRRPRSHDEKSPWMLHLMAVHGGTAGAITYETDRMRFIGRGRTVASPQAMSDGSALSDSHGSVLDPVVAIRHRITLDADETVIIDMVSGVSETRDGAMAMIEKYKDKRLADRVFEMAWTHSQVVLRQINATEADAQVYARLANSVLYANSLLRADPAILLKNRRGQSGLWGYAISGDLPIMLLQISDTDNIDLVRQLVQAHAYWRLKGLVVDLVIWNEDRGGYRAALQEQIMGLVAAGIEALVIDRPGGIFVRSAELISEEDRILFESVARVIVSDRRGGLEDQISRRTAAEVRAPHLNMPRLNPMRAYRPESQLSSGQSSTLKRNDLLFDNGLGGFAPDGREYVITTTHANTTPAPWVNVLANARFGTVVSENGMSYTWSENAHEYRLSPWNNDPVSDSGGEAFYVRDEENGHFWSPTPLPARGVTPYVSRHGFGYSTFEHIEDGIRSELTIYVALDAAVKFTTLKVRNESGRARRLSATGFVEWVLGDLKPKTAMHVVSDIDPLSGGLYARNAYNSEFSDRVSFFDTDDATRTFTGDRTEFIGRNGTLRNPAAMSRTHLSNKVGAGLDPCAAIQVAFELADGEERVSIFRLGAGRNIGDAREMLKRHRGPAVARETLEKVHQYWLQTLSAVQVDTPDPSINLLANGWLLYQTLACRIWARSGYYQSGGAYGFRDQLQDTMALIHAEPRLVREHLLLCASRQFREGDVQHWWHPPTGRGVRTHCSDDYLWLPLVACRYVLSIGDTGVLDESAHFLEGRPVNPGDDSYYDLPSRSDETASLYQHCVRAIEHGLNFGRNGLPLMGSGDWNDGMNLVGIGDKGESIWLGFFLCEVLRQFAQVARLHGDPVFADRCVSERVKLAHNLEANGWDGEWYRRAYFDDGRALGSAGNDECQIDSIAQSWSVLSGVGSEERVKTAMTSLDNRLVRRDKAIIQLLDPPFDKSDMDPGYIRGYVPGVRENGGQYTHGAIWAAMAFAALGDNQRAWELTNMINPVNHARSREEVALYKVEPYVISADVYGVEPHIGRGGWSWYTGSAGWMYRLLLESLLGLRLDVDRLHFSPCLPADWPGFKMQYRYRRTIYDISVVQKINVAALEGEIAGVVEVVVDGVAQAAGSILLSDDKRPHQVEVRVMVGANK
ncbi:MAG: glucoamylase family protein [Betaproteobacteria bacterium]